MSDMPILFTLEDIGKAFRAERRSLGKTQQWVAEQAGCRRQTVSDLEAGKNVTLETLVWSLNALGKRLDIVDAGLTAEEVAAMLAEDDDDGDTERAKELPEPRDGQPP